MGALPDGESTSVTSDSQECNENGTGVVSSPFTPRVTEAADGTNEKARMSRSVVAVPLSSPFICEARASRRRALDLCSARQPVHVAMHALECGGQISRLPQALLGRTELGVEWGLSESGSRLPGTLI